MPKARKIRGIAVVLGMVGLAVILPLSTAENNKPTTEKTAGLKTRTLPVGAPLAASFTAEDEVHDYAIDLRAGDFLFVELRQHGIDVVVALLDGRDRELIKVDSPGGAYSTERLGFVAEQSGKFRVRIQPPDALRERRYEIAAAQPRAAGPKEHEYAQACLDMSAADALRREPSASQHHLALHRYRRARQSWHDLGEPVMEIVATNRVAQVWMRLDRHRQAIRGYQKALALLDAVGSLGKDSQDLTAQKIDLLLRATDVYRIDRQPEKARHAANMALLLSRSIHDKSGEATALNNLALQHRDAGHYEAALHNHRQAAEIFRELGDLFRQTVALFNVGDDYRLLGDFQAATEACKEAVDASQQTASPFAVSKAYGCLGWAYHGQGRYSEALELHGQAIALAREDNHQLELAGYLDRQGTTYQALKRHGDALRSYEEALQIFEQADHTLYRRNVLLNLGRLHVDWGFPKQALEYSRRAGDLMTRENDQDVEAFRLLINARAERQLGNLEAAQLHVEQALDHVESVRSNIETVALRLNFLVEPRRYFYDFYVDLLMDQRGVTPETEQRAFTVAERGKARVFLEKLHDSRWSDREPPAPLDLFEIQRLLDSETILLAYSSGESRSFLWRVSTDNVDSYVLRPGNEIDKLARAYHQSLKESFRTENQGKLTILARDLSDAVLAEVDDTLGERRLVIVPDGALHYVPFAALVKPSTGDPLIVDHEIVTLPSASVLAVLREASADNTNLWTVAAVGDPVSERTDPRLKDRPGERALPVSAAEHEFRHTLRSAFRSASDSADFPRLTWSEAEVKEILSMVPESRKLGFLGFDASRENVLSGALKPFDVVHFAVHGYIDTDRPEFSGLVLSLYDRRGHRRKGFLLSNEIHELDLPAELVVLSACSTALGREIHGEGLVGLTRGFMYAGASRVMVSLWDVSDRGTAELMTRFYRALLEDELLPAAALRKAQKSMLSDPSFSRPYYWAPFLLQGDWR